MLLHVVTNTFFAFQSSGDNTPGNRFTLTFNNWEDSAPTMPAWVVVKPGMMEMETEMEMEILMKCLLTNFHHTPGLGLTGFTTATSIPGIVLNEAYTE